MGSKLFKELAGKDSEFQKTTTTKKLTCLFNGAQYNTRQAWGLLSCMIAKINK